MLSGLKTTGRKTCFSSLRCGLTSGLRVNYRTGYYDTDDKVKSTLDACAYLCWGLLAATLTLQTTSMCTHACGDESVELPQSCSIISPSASTTVFFFFFFTRKQNIVTSRDSKNACCRYGKLQSDTTAADLALPKDRVPGKAWLLLAADCRTSISHYC